MVLYNRSAILRSGIRSHYVARRFQSSSQQSHSDFIEHVAKFNVPKGIDTLLDFLSWQGNEIVSPRARDGLNPFLIPLARSATDNEHICYLRWPTQKDTMELQIVKTCPAGVKLLSTSTEHYIQKEAITADFQGHPDAPKLLAKAFNSNLTTKSYNAGDATKFANSGKFPIDTAKRLNLALDRFLLTKVGPFPDGYQRLAFEFFDSKNDISALVTCERSVNLFYGWGFPVVLHSSMLAKIGRVKEARDGALSALSSPKWTICETKEEMDEIIKRAGFTDFKAVGNMHAVRANDPRTKDQEEGVTIEQIKLDQAAHLMDAVALGAVNGGWNTARADIATKYREGGYPDIATFIETVN